MRRRTNRLSGGDPSEKRRSGDPAEHYSETQLPFTHAFVAGHAISFTHCPSVPQWRGVVELAHERWFGAQTPVHVEPTQVWFTHALPEKTPFVQVCAAFW